MHSLDGEQPTRHGVEMFLVSRVDLVAALACLSIQILPTGERAAGQKVAFYQCESTLDAPRPVGIAPLMRHKAEPEAFRERLHLGHRNHLFSRAAQHHHMRVVDHHPGWTAPR
jgi:hypothetical protein